MTVYYIFEDYGYTSEICHFETTELELAYGAFEDICFWEDGLIELAYFEEDGTYEVLKRRDFSG